MIVELTQMTVFSRTYLYKLYNNTVKQSSVEEVKSKIDPKDKCPKVKKGGTKVLKNDKREQKVQNMFLKTRHSGREGRMGLHFWFIPSKKADGLRLIRLPAGGSLVVLLHALKSTEKGGPLAGIAFLPQLSETGTKDQSQLS